MSRDGVRRAVGFIAAAHRSYSSCTQYRENVDEARADARASAGSRTSRSSTSATGTRIRASSKRTPTTCATRSHALPEAVRDRARLIFTAHSIPVSMAERYPYQRQLEESARAVADRARDRGEAGTGRCVYPEPQRTAGGSVARARRLRLPARGSGAGGLRGGGALPRRVSSAITSKCSTTSTSRPPACAASSDCRWRAPRRSTIIPRFVDAMADAVLRRSTATTSGRPLQIVAPGWQR